MARPETDTDVLIVGAGPSGVMASLLLEQQGVATRIVDKRPSHKRAPAAHVVNARTLEICRQAGVDGAALAEAAKDPAQASTVFWVTKLGGEVLGQLPFERQGEAELAVTPTPLRNISQNRFEPILLAALAERASAEPLWDHEWLASRVEGETVRSRVRRRASGEEREITSRYVVAADGAGSPIRHSLGIGMEGPERLQAFIMIHFHGGLRGVPQVPPGVLFFVCDPAGGGGAFVVHDLDREAVYMHPFDPEAEDPASYDAARCADILREALEDPGLPFEIANVGPWAMTAQVASRYREGPIFLVGDAAHRFPPTGGLGLNTGVQDAHNLAWKLAFVIRRGAGEALLESYETERRPVAQRNAQQSLANAMRLFEVVQALGVTDFSDASRLRMKATLADEAGRRRVREAIERQAEHFDMPGLQLGFGYGAGALVRGTQGDEAPGAPDPRRFEPSGRPGWRLPHAWLRGGRAPESLLDRVPLDRPLLVAGPEGEPWMEAARARGGAALAALRLSADGVEGFELWCAAAGIAPAGALLVRPDQHVAWRSRGAVRDPRRALEGALGALRG